MRQITLAHPSNKLENELVKLFHSSGLPLHFNKKGNKQFTNYQRVSLIILFRRSKKSIRDFIEELYESRWISWLGLKKIPRKSTLHDWLKIFDMKILRKVCKLLLPKKLSITSIDSTGIDAWQRSRHYEKRCEQFEKKLPPMNYAKTSLFIDVESQIILDWDLVMSREHDVKIAERIFKRNTLKNIFGLGDKGYDSENLHEVARANGINFFAPVRKMDKKAFSYKRPSGFYRRKCKDNPPDFKGMRSIVESINFVLKRTQITSLRSKKHFMRERELGWHIVLYNIKRKIRISSKDEIQTFIFCRIKIWLIRTSLVYQHI